MIGNVKMQTIKQRIGRPAVIFSPHTPSPLLLVTVKNEEKRRLTL